MPVMRQTGPMQRWRKYARGGVGMRGLGQDATLACGDVGQPDCPVDTSGDLAAIQASGQLNQLYTSGGPNESAPVSVYTPVTSFSSANIGQSMSCAPGYVVVDASGNCGPASTLAATLAAPGGAATLGLTAQQAAALTASLNAANTAIKIATGQAPATSPLPVSTNPFASISTTTWIIAAVAVVGVLMLSGRKR